MQKSAGIIIGTDYPKVRTRPSAGARSRALVSDLCPPQPSRHMADRTLVHARPQPVVDHKVVSKENMGKIAKAYEAYKKTQSSGAGGGPPKKKLKAGK